MLKQDLMMGRSANSMIGLPIFSLDHGRRIASVKDVIYDGRHSKLLAFTIEQAGVFSPKRMVLPFENIKSIGRDAVIVESADVFVSERELPEIREIALHGENISGKVLLTQSGSRLGNVVDVLIDEAAGNAISYEVSGGFGKDIGSGRNYAAAPSASVVGVDAIVVPDDTETTFAEQTPGGLSGAYEGAMEKGSQYGKQAAVYTQAQEIHLSQGKIAGTSVYDDAGGLIVGKDEMITEFAIDHAVRTGKMHQVALAAGVGGAAAGYEATRAHATGAQSLWDDTKIWFAETWANITHATRESSNRAVRRSAVSAQRKFLTGKIAANDAVDGAGNVILHRGDVITPLVIDTLDRDGMLESVKVQPDVKEEAPSMRVVLEKPELHERHKVRPHI